MGLRYRKSISILPGVRLNMGLNSMSISAGVPGFRKTISTTGRVTTSVGIPGTGLYYVDSKKISDTGSRRSYNPPPAPVETRTEARKPEKHRTEFDNTAPDDPVPETTNTETQKKESPHDFIISICKVCDDTVDWTEALADSTPPDESYNPQMWEYYHNISKDILRGDIDAYLKVIYEVNPLDDLLDYGIGFEFGTDDSHKIEVEFSANESSIEKYKSDVSAEEYNRLLQDYFCSLCIRVARDMFALLPVRETIVHCTCDKKTVISVKFDRTTMGTLSYGYIDPSETIEKFQHVMRFDAKEGFAGISRL